MIRVNLILVGLVAGTALADVTLSFDGTVDGKPGTTTLRFQGKRALITHEKKDDGRQAVVLRDGEGKRTLVIDHATKSYTEFSDEAASAMKARAEAMRAQMAPQLANLPPEQRKKLEAMMAQQAAPAAAEAKKKAYTFEKKGGTRKVLGKSCQTYVIKVDGVVDGEGCFIAWKDAGISRDALREQLKAAMEGVPVGGAGPGRELRARDVARAARVAEEGERGGPGGDRDDVDEAVDGLDSSRDLRGAEGLHGAHAADGRAAGAVTTGGG